MSFVRYPKTQSLKDARHLYLKRFSSKKFVELDEDKLPVFNFIPAPKLTLLGTVKAHGTHVDVLLTIEGNLQVQSRNRIITPDDDHCGFAKFVQSNADYFLELLDGKLDYVLSGEWFGGGIMNGMSITGMEKTFMMFDRFAKSCPERRIYNTSDFLMYRVEEVDFNLPLEELVAQLGYYVDIVEKDCPIGADLNPETESTVGEGIVWEFVNPDSETVTFKMKGLEHRRVGKKQTRVAKNTPENVSEFVNASLTVDRLEQGIEFLKEMKYPVDKTSMAYYLQWIGNDIQTECKLEMEEAGLIWKEVSRVVNHTAVKYLLSY